MLTANYVYVCILDTFNNLVDIYKHQLASYSVVRSLDCVVRQSVARRVGCCVGSSVRFRNGISVAFGCLSKGGWPVVAVVGARGVVVLTAGLSI